MKPPISLKPSKKAPGKFSVSEEIIASLKAAVAWAAGENVPVRVTTAQVPSAAVWFINRAPAPDPGVDLSLLLWSGDAPAAGRPPQNRRSETSSVPRMAS